MKKYWNVGILSARNGLKIQPDFDFSNSPHFDILIVPGGMEQKK